MQALRDSRPRFKGAVTKISTKLDGLEDEDATSIARLDVDYINDQLDSLKRTEKKYHLNLEDTQAHAPEDNDELDIFQDEEDAALEGFQRVLSKARGKAKCLIALKRIQQGLARLNHEIETLEASLSSRPDANHSNSYSNVSGKFISLNQMWIDADLPMDHLLNKDLEAFTGRLHYLATDIASAKERSTPATVTSTLPTIIPKPERNNTKLPPISLPTFKGDVLKWPTFWSQFVASIDSHPDLPESSKLAYLRNAIKDPEADILLHPSIDGPDSYRILVKELHHRYERTKKIHRQLVDKLWNLPSAKYNLSDMRNLMDSSTSIINCLKATGHFTIEDVCTSLIYSRLPYKAQAAWDEEKPRTTKVRPYNLLLDFMADKCETLADHQSTTPSSTPAPEKKPPAKKQNFHSKPKNVKSQQVYSVTPPTPSPSTPSAPPQWKYECLLCKPTKHPLNLCPKWLGFTIEQRLTQVKDRKLCANCLVPGHETTDCRNKYKCQVCRQPHHTSIHKDSPILVASALMQSRHLPHVLLMTAEVLLTGPSGQQMKARAFLDPGAGLSIVSSRVTQTLKLPLEASHTSFATVQGTKCQGSKYLTDIVVSSLYHDKSFDCRPAVVKTVTGNIPNKLLAPVHDFPHLTGLCLADPNFHIPARVDILLGAELWLQLQQAAPAILSENPNSEPGAQLTAFGWVVVGPTKAQASSSQDILTGHVQPMSNDELHDLAHKFWLSESAEVPETTISSVNDQVEQHYEETVTYSPTSSLYQVTLPRKPDARPLGTSKPQAIQRYISNEASIERKGVTEAFQDQIQGYLDAGHAEPVPPAEQDNPHFYLPMHSVVKQSSTSTKLRVVFDGSATSSSGASLNSLLRIGPTLQPPLADTLMKFRTYPVALTADISKMYRAVELCLTDRDLHRFVWRPSPKDQLQSFRMTRVTFGVSASPYVAIKTLQQTAKDHGADHPTAAAHIQSSFYVDDLLAGAQNPEEAKKLFSDLRSILSKGSFNLCKWRSSDTNVLDSIPTDLQEKLLTKDVTSDQDSAYPKALGLQWNSQEDVMSPTIHPPSNYLQTKRGIISDVSKTFDVLGWIAPAILPMKIMYQSLWDRGQEWDGVAPPHVIEEHSRWRQQMPCLSAMKLPRYYAGHPQPIHQELHGFSDASKHASGAVVYIRSTYSNHEPTVSLVTAKTKVAKLNTLKKTKKTKKVEEEDSQPPLESSTSSDTPSLNNAPRTELDAAVLLTKLLIHVAAVLGIPLKHLTAWTDNSAVFSWLDGNQRDQDRFTTNRVSFILNHTTPSTWKHVPGIQNPADCASRGMDPTTLLKHDLWWRGPAFLYTEPVSVPRQPTRRPNKIQQPPDDHPIFTIISQVDNRTDFTSNLLVRTNSYQLLISMTAWCFRFFTRLKDGRPSPDDRTNFLQLEELEAAEHWLLKQSQLRSFPKDYDTLVQKGKIAPTSKLRLLTPYITPDEGLIRVGGRLEHTTLPFSHQHPIIVDAKDVLIQKMFEHLHKKLHHCGPTTLLCNTSREVHVVGARRLSRRICSLCPRCRRVQPRPTQQLMGELPPERVTSDQPAFTNVGMDFAGPFTIGNGRGQSRSESYLCIFVCLATKAVHLELTKEMKTSDFIRCLQRFTSRRNCPESLHCDNGSNFVGARRELDAFYRFLAQKDTDDAIRQHLLHKKIKWNFIPPAAPHFGGLWEGAVRSMKKYLRRVMGTLIFTYEELETIMCQIEHCLNSRPLLPIYCHDTEGISPLTPGHFLYLNAPRAYPVEPSLPTEIRLQKRWQRCQAVVHHFWTRWSQEYLQSLQSRSKWQQRQPNLQVGDIVVFKPKDHFSCHWPLAKVLKVYPGEDGLVRAALIKPSFYATERKRPVAKLSLVYRENPQLQPTTSLGSPGSMSRQESSTPDNRTPTTMEAARQPTRVCSPPPATPTTAAQPQAAVSRATPQRVQPPRACKQPTT